MGITKNKKTDEFIITMARETFPDREIPKVQELTEGMCNAAYMLTFEDGFQTVLKIASANNDGFMTNESNLMDAEIRAMKIVKESTNIKVAEVYMYDTSKKLCDGNYFFMEKLEGSSWITLVDNLGEEVNSALHKEVGKIQKQLALVKGDKFGLLGDDTHQFDTLYEFVYFLINNVLCDAEKRDVEIGEPKSEILMKLEEDKCLFEKVTIPTLVHWDMWEGNIFVKDGQITGVIDWERAMWGEPFMDDRFRHHNRNADFMEGFGIEHLSEEELRRIYWYDILLYLTMMTEVTYREYEDDGQYRWVKPLFDEVWNNLFDEV